MEEVADFFVFSHKRMMYYFRLDKLKVNECPAGLEDWPRRVGDPPPPEGL